MHLLSINDPLHYLMLATILNMAFNLVKMDISTM